jgi:invasion protein IalB
MPDPRFTAVWVIATGLLIALGGKTLAQERTTATYDDWVLQCAVQAGPPAQKTCDIEQLTQMQSQGRSVPLSRIAITRPEKGQPTRLTVQVPVNVYLRAEVRVQAARPILGSQRLSTAACQPVVSPILS